MVQVLIVHDGSHPQRGLVQRISGSRRTALGPRRVSHINDGTPSDGVHPETLHIVRAVNGRRTNFASNYQFELRATPEVASTRATAWLSFPRTVAVVTCASEE